LTRPALTVGFLVDTLGEDYQRRIFSGLNEEAVRLNIGVVCFAGGQLSASRPQVHQNRVYECVSPTNLDALVVTSGTLGNKVGEDTLASFVESYRPLSVCSVGVELAGFPSVAVDNKAGARQALEHLILDAGRRRIAFIRGPEHNREAEERFMVYRDVLREHRIALNPDMVTMGDFEAPSGARAVEILLDERHMGFDAIMAASDLMALGAMNRLIERGVPVPDRVSVVGFDDVEAARFAPAPLTTVRQPLLELGRRALESVIAQFFGNDTPERLVLPAVLIKRRSTIGAPGRNESTGPSPQLTDSSSFEIAYHALRPELLLELEAILDSRGLEHDWAEQLTSAFVSEISGRRSGLLRRTMFLEYLEQLLLHVVSNQGDTAKCQELITVLRRHLVPLVRHTSYQRERTEELLHEARIVSGSIAERYQVQQRLMMRHWRRSTQEVGAALLRCGSHEQLGDKLCELLPQLGIPACLLCTFQADGSTRLLCGFDGARRFPESEPITFARHELLPTGLLGTARRTLLVETLYLEERSLGYAVFEIGPAEPEVYELLSDYLTGALRGLPAT
jgi:DNA-binding LacI/PurR family transcriptional regulator